MNVESGATVFIRFGDPSPEIGQVLRVANSADMATMAPQPKLVLPFLEVASTGGKASRHLTPSLSGGPSGRLEDMLQVLQRYCSVLLIAFVRHLELRPDVIQHVFKVVFAGNSCAGADFLCRSEDRGQGEGRAGAVRQDAWPQMSGGHTNRHRNVCREAAAEVIQEGGDDKKGAKVACQVLGGFHGRFALVAGNR